MPPSVEYADRLRRMSGERSRSLLPEACVKAGDGGLAPWSEVRLPCFCGVLRTQWLAAVACHAGWNAWLAGGAGHLAEIKATANRAVRRLDLPGQTVYLKCFARRTWRDALRGAIGGDRARREFDRLCWLEQQGMGAARPLGWGIRRNGPSVTESVLLLAGVEDAVPLAQYASLRGPARRRLIEAVAHFVADLHRAGLYHGDLHAENLLVRQPQGGGYPALSASDLVVIDLGRSRLVPHGGWHAARADLAILYSAWNGRLSRLERLRFLLAYRKARGGRTMPPLAQAAQEIDHAGWAVARRVARRLDRRAVRGNEGFSVHREGRWVVWATGENAASAALGTVPAMSARTSNGLRAWQMGHALALRGIPVVRPKTLIRHRGWLIADEWLSFEEIPGAVTLDAVCEKEPRESRRQRSRRLADLAVSAGTILGQLHCWQFAAGALRRADFLAVCQDGRWGLVIRHPERIGQGVRSLRQRRSDLTRWLAGTGLARLFSRTDLLRLLRAYFAQWPPGDRPLRHFWPAVVSFAN